MRGWNDWSLTEKIVRICRHIIGLPFLITGQILTFVGWLFLWTAEEREETRGKEIFLIEIKIKGW